MKNEANLFELARVFLKLGTTAFGGPAAHIAMMEEEIVRRRQWLSQEEFLDLLGATNLIPGPNSTELAIHIGHKVGGSRGLLVAGSLFILPAFLIVWCLAYFYVKFGSLPAFQSVFVFIKPVILAVIAQATWNLSRKAVKDVRLGILALISLPLYLLWGNEVLVLFIIALANLVIRIKPNTSSIKNFALFFIPLFVLQPLSQAWAATTQNQKIPLENLFLFFFKVGSVLFGSGYVLVAFLQNDLVNTHQWITQQQLVDAIAVGQFTPGPVFTTATFIGYLISGHLGAVVGTLGIFIPAFFFVAVSAPLIPRLRRSKWTAPILDGLNVASLSLMLVAAIVIAKDVAFSYYGAIATVISFIFLLKFKVNSSWLVLGAGFIGFLVNL